MTTTTLKLEERNIQCPYCGEQISVILDCSIEHQEYIEDCQVCCRPIEIHVTIDPQQGILLSLFHENE